jgi:hypothetical protein
MKQPRFSQFDLLLPDSNLLGGSRMRLVHHMIGTFLLPAMDSAFDPGMTGNHRCNGLYGCKFRSGTAHGGKAEDQDSLRHNRKLH